MLDKNAKIYVAGHRGLVGSAIWKNLEEKGYTNLIGKTHTELDLLDGVAVRRFFDEEQPEYVFLAAAFVGGIMANSIYRADFIYKNLQIQQNVIGESFRHGVKKLLFLGSTCIYPRDAEQPMKEDALLTSPLEYTNEPYAIAYFGKDGKDNSAGVDISGDKGTQATQAMVSLVNNPNFVNDLQGVGIAGLRDGSVGAYFSGSWDYKSVKEILGDKFGAVSLPTVKIGGKDKQMLAFAGSKAIAVNPNCKYQQVAVALAKYLGSKDAQKKHYELRGVIPCNTELLATDEVKKDALVTAQNDTFNKTSVIQTTVTGMNDYWAPAQNFAKAIVNGEITADNAAAKTQDFYKQINTSIAK